MIVVKVELHSAITGKVTEIGRMHIANTGSGTVNRGNYVARLMRRGTTTLLREGEVRDHARKSSTVWKLVQKAIESTQA